MTYESFIERSLVVASPGGGRNAYSLTGKGKEALASELYRLAGSVDKRLEWLSWQRNEIYRQIEKLLKPTK